MVMPALQTLAARCMMLLAGAFVGVTPASADGDGLAAVPGRDGIELSWTGTASPDASRSVWRWEENEAAVEIGRTRGESGFVDRSARVNRLYYYRVDGIDGSVRSVLSRFSEPFNCPATPPVPLGVDRTESFRTPSGRAVSFTIRAPEKRPAVVVVPRCAGRDGCSDRGNIHSAIAKVIEAGGGLVQLESGIYDIKPPDRAGIYSQIDITNATDLVLAGAAPRDGSPSTVLRLDATRVGDRGPGKLQGLSISGSTRVLIRDVAIDWSQPTAIPGHVFDADNGEQRFVVDDPAYYIPEPANPPGINIINGYDFTQRTYVLAPWARFGFPPGMVRFNPNFAADGSYHYAYKGRPIPNGSSVIGIVGTGVDVRVAGNSNDISFEGVHLWSGGGGGFIFGPNGRGYRITNSRITRKPDALLEPGERPRFISLRGDSDARSTNGDILIENSEFAFVEDDGFNIVGVMVQGMSGTEIVSASEITFAMRGWNPFANAASAEDVLVLSDPHTLRSITAMPLGIQSRTMRYDAATQEFSYRFKLTAEAPELLAYKGRALDALPYFSDPRHISAPYVLRNNCMRDTAGGRFVLQSGPGLIEANVTANMGGPGIELSASPVSWREGPGAVDVIVRNNVVTGGGRWLSDYDGAGRLTGRATGWLVGAGISVEARDVTGFLARGAPNAHLRIENNLVVNALGLGILVSAASDVEVSGNVVVNANTEPFVAGYDALYCGAKAHGFQREGIGQPWCLGRSAARGSILITHADRVSVSGNRTLGSSQGVVVVDQPPH